MILPENAMHFRPDSSPQAARLRWRQDWISPDESGALGGDELPWEQSLRRSAGLEWHQNGCY